MLGQRNQVQSINQEVQFLGLGTFNTIRIELQTNQDSASPMTVECQTPLIVSGIPCAHSTHTCLQCLQQPGELVVVHLHSNITTAG